MAVIAATVIAARSYGVDFSEAAAVWPHHAWPRGRIKLLRESLAVVQAHDQPLRRWFFDDDLDLLVWFDEADSPVGFQLIYPTSDGPRVLTHRPSGYVTHNSIDTGPSDGFPWNPSALLAADGVFNAPRVLEDFLARAGNQDPAVVAFVAASIERYGSGR